MKAMIIDDEPPARRELRRLLSDFSWVEIVGEAGDVEQAAGMVESLSPELLSSTFKCRAVPDSICLPAWSTCRK